jgi:3'(2'), 5'-bisphosphate nucleotidase
MLSSSALKLIEIAMSASREIMEVYNSDFSSRQKADLTPVTDADERAERVILAALRQHWPEIPVISEEAAAISMPEAAGQRFFLVDPLDGTKEFLSRNGEFTVNIAEIENGAPTRGVVMAPAIGKIWAGETATGAVTADCALTSAIGDLRWKPCKVRRRNRDEGVIVIASRSHRDEKTDNYLATINVSTTTSVGSSVKFCMIAEGKADLYPRFGRTMEWDTAAGHAVLKAAGGHVRDTSGAELGYGKFQGGFENPSFIANNE